MHGGPRQPGENAAQVDSPALQDGEPLSQHQLLNASFPLLGVAPMALLVVILVSQMFSDCVNQRPLRRELAFVLALPARL